MADRLAARMRDIQPFHVMELLARARALEAQGRSIIHLEIGEPDFATPPAVVAAAQQALQAGQTHYTPALGLPALREAISAFYRQRHQVEVSSERIVVTPGASGALLLALGVLVDPGDAVLLADPGYPCNKNFVRFLAGAPLSVPVDAASNFQLTARHIEQHWSTQTKAALVASPSNPTGTVVGADELRAIHAAVAQRGGSLIVDEIYHGLIYGRQDETALAISDQLFVINSFSKYFCMTGWRLGWLVVPPGYVEAVDKLAQNIFLAAPTVSQHAALAAFAPQTIAELEQRRAEYRRRRDFLIPALRQLGFEVPCEPQGAFYIYADCSRLTSDSYPFVLDLLDKAGVAVTPGLDFGANLPQRYVRFSYANSLENLMEAVARIGRFLEER